MFKKSFFYAFILALGALTLAAQPPANSVRITDQSGSAQSNRPFTISRVFAQGDIPHYPQAVIGGAPVTTQADVKTRWPDGSVQHAMISFLASVGANGSITVSFQDQPTGNNAGALTQSQMLALSWGAEIDLTNNGTAQSANAAAMLSAGSWSYWLQGPICTQVIVEDRSPALAYDMGWDSYKPLHPIFVLTFYPTSTAGVKVEMIVENMWTTKLEDQTYSVTLQTGNPLSAVYSKSGFTHIAQSRWRKTYWSGPQPGAVNVDYNLPYMIYSQVVPNWDLGRTVPASAISSDVNSFNNSDQGDLGGHALWLQAMGQTGGRYDLGIFPVWYVHYLFTFDPRMYNLLLGMAEVSGHVPNHYRESDPNRYFDSGHTVKAFGLPISIEARPSMSLAAGPSAGSDGVTPVGATSTGGWSWDLAHEPAFAYIPYLITGDWYFLEELQFDASAALICGNAAFNFYSRGNQIGWIPYALQTRAVAWGLRDLSEATFASPDGSAQKGYYLQKLYNNIQVEEGYQNITNGAFPPSNASCPGYSPSATGDKWCYGRMIVGEGKTNPLHFIDHGDPYGGGCGGVDDLVASGDPYACSYGDSSFEYGYKYGVLGHMQELGFPVGPLNQVVFTNLLHQILDPSVNPWLVAVYHMPVYRASTNTYYQSWPEYMLGFTTSAVCGNGSNATINWRTITGWNGTCNGGSSDSDVTSPGYPHIMRGAASYLAGWGVNDGSLLGVNAWNWMVANVGYESQTGINPQWEILPRAQSGVAPASACDLNGDGVVNALDVQLAINQAFSLVGCTNADLVGSGSCTVVDVQRVVNASLGGACRLGP